MDLRQQNRRVALWVLGGMFTFAIITAVFVVATAPYRRQVDHDQPVRKEMRDYIPEAAVLGIGAAIIGGFIVWRIGTKSQ